MKTDQDIKSGQALPQLVEMAVRYPAGKAGGTNPSAKQADIIVVPAGGG